MSRENVERLRRRYEAFNVTGELDLDLWATDVEYVQTGDVGRRRNRLPRAGRGRSGGEGAHGCLEGFRVWALLDLGRPSACVCSPARSGATRGASIDASFAHIATFRGSEITHWRAYAHREEALGGRGARGLSPLIVREAELSALEAGLARAAGSGQVVGELTPSRVARWCCSPATPAAIAAFADRAQVAATEL